MLARTTWLRWGSPKSSRTGSCAHSKAVLLVMPLPPPQQPGAAGAGAAGAGAAGAGAGTKATAGAGAGTTSPRKAASASVMASQLQRPTLTQQYAVACVCAASHRNTQVSLFQDGLIAMSQVTKVTATTKQVKKSLVVKTKSALGPYKDPSTPSAGGDCANLKCGLSNAFVMMCPEMVPDDDRDNCTL